MSEEENWEVERILKTKETQDGTMYLVKWKGFPESENTWEPFENLAGCLEVLNDFYNMNTQSISDIAKSDEKSENNEEPEISAPEQPPIEQLQISTPSTPEVKQRHKRNKKDKIESKKTKDPLTDNNIIILGFANNKKYMVVRCGNGCIRHLRVREITNKFPEKFCAYLENQCLDVNISDVW